MLNILTRALIAFALILPFSLPTLAKAPVWKVSKGDDYFYLGGTIHLLAEDDYPLPVAFDAAFAAADILYFETDMQAMSSPSAQAKMLPIFMFADERTLRGELSAEVYAELELFLAERQIPIANFAKFTPAGISLTLTAIELQRMGVMEANGESHGVDDHYTKRGIAAQKQIDALETLDEQIAFMMSMNDEDSDQIVKSTLRDLHNLESDWEKLLAAWRTGDLAALQKLGIEPMQEFPKLFQLLLVQRNTNWLKKMEPMITTPEIEFILVGALHMVGQDGLLNRLQLAGYQIEQSQ